MPEDPLLVDPSAPASPGPDDPTHIMHRAYASTKSILWLCAYGGALVLVIAAITYRAFPVVVSAPGSVTPTWELHLLMLVACAGGLGGLLHLFTSLGRFVGDRQLLRSWLLFYYMRPVVGAATGVVFYLVLRTGVLSPMDVSTASTANFNVYGILSMSALAGLFSRQALDKLAEIFEVMFQKTKEDLASRSAKQLFGRSETVEASQRLSPNPVPTTEVFGTEKVRGDDR